MTNFWTVVQVIVFVIYLTCYPNNLSFSHMWSVCCRFVGFRVGLIRSKGGEDRGEKGVGVCYDLQTKQTLAVITVYLAAADLQITWSSMKDR